MALRSSSTDEIIGNMMRRSPYRAARSSAQLYEEQVGAVEADTDRAVAEERILFLLQRQCGHFLVAADVQRADDDRTAVHGLDRLFIRLELLLLARQVGTVHEQELRAEQADALTAQLRYADCVTRRTDVALDDDAAAVARLARTVPERREHCAALIILRLLFRELHERLLVRLCDKLACRAVQQQLHAVPDGVEAIARAHDRRNAHRARHDGRVARAAADFRDEADHRLAAHLRGIRRRKVVRDDECTAQ